jgi:predicted house-cleaning NTP pyrophosphatase (Maf/HAM1 superfamily)
LVIFCFVFFKLGNDGSSSVQKEFLEWEKVKQQKLEEYRARKLGADCTGSCKFSKSNQNFITGD